MADFDIDNQNVILGGPFGAYRAIPPNNQIELDSVESITDFVTINRTETPDISTTPVRQNVTDTLVENQNFISDTLSRVGINFSPEDNPLNDYASYAYHIRWFLTDERTAYNGVDPLNPNGDSLNKTIIAESGVTAGFNIVDFEIENTCGPGSRTLNTVSTKWSMTLAEPYGISLIDKIRASALTQPVINYMRAPYFIDVWFTGYDEDGNILDDKLFYQLFRVNILDMSVDLTEGGSKYVITGIFDNDIGFSNQNSIPQGGINIQAETVGGFFRLLARNLTEQQKLSLQQDFADVEYQINVPPEMQNWRFRDSDLSTQDSRNDDMTVEVNNGQLNVTITPGTSIEVIVNRVLSMCPEAEPWVRGEVNGGTAGTNAAELSTNGVASWVMVHSATEIIGFNYYTRDYIRKVTYTLIRYRTTRTGADYPTLTILESEAVQREKINFFENANAIKKLYQYIYTGQNTEIINFDIKIENFWAITLPVWEGVNNYHNFTQGLLRNTDAVGDQQRDGTYNRSALLSSLQVRIEDLTEAIQYAQADGTTGTQNYADWTSELEALQRDEQILRTYPQSAVYFNTRSAADREQAIRSGITPSPGELTVSRALQSIAPVREALERTSQLLNNQQAVRYAEDLRNLRPDVTADPLQLVIKPDNQPTWQNAALSGDSNKSIANSNSLGLPNSRSFIGTILGNMFDPTFFNIIEMEIRGDPYWIGQSNIRQNAIANTFGQQNSDPRFANLQAYDHFFVLVFRSGELYNEDTGLMQFTETSDFFNGAYGVVLVKNVFRNGKFTQVLTAAKDVFAQKVSANLSDATTGDISIEPVDQSSAVPERIGNTGITNSPLSISDAVGIAP